MSANDPKRTSRLDSVPTNGWCLPPLGDLAGQAVSLNDPKQTSPIYLPLRGAAGPMRADFDIDLRAVSKGKLGPSPSG